MRDLIEQKLIPDDVTHHGAHAGARGADPAHRRIAARRAPRHRARLQRHRAGVAQGGVRHDACPRSCSWSRNRSRSSSNSPTRMPETEWVLEYSPETFSMTELPVALEACNTAIRAWDAGPGRPIIINLPTTVENATPNIYADQIEWMSTQLERREHVVRLPAHAQRSRHRRRGRRARPAGGRASRRRLSVRQRRTLGQRGPGDAGAQLLLAGHPSRASISRTSTPSRARSSRPRACRSIRAIPYVGDLVFTRSPGSHQDAIKKGMAAQKPDAHLGSAVHPGRSRPISAAPTTASSASTASRARAASPIFSSATTAW